MHRLKQMEKKKNFQFNFRRFSIIIFRCISLFCVLWRFFVFEGICIWSDVKCSMCNVHDACVKIIVRILHIDLFKDNTVFDQFIMQAYAGHTSIVVIQLQKAFE